jgi:hypothetical protein
MKAGAETARGNSRDSSSLPATQLGLLIQGCVQLSNGRGAANVQTYRAFASYPSELVATTDQHGAYQAEFVYIPGDEMITVWAEKPGFTFEPEVYYWRHYAGYEAITLDLIAEPIRCTYLPFITK